MSHPKIKIVVIGGGNGSALTLRALKAYADEFEIAAVISMSDSGGSSGKLRQEFNTVPPGDILRAVLALSVYDYGVLKKIFYQRRFNAAGKFSGHNLGNIFLILGEQYSGDFVTALRALEQAVGAAGCTYPVTLAPNNLCAELSNGQIIRTEAALDEPAYDRSLKIKRVWLEPEAAIYGAARQVIEEAEVIFFSPGSLYTSVIATLLPAGVREAIGKSKARLAYITGDAYELDGETGPERLSDYVTALQSYLPRRLDAIIYNNHPLNALQRQRYAEKRWAQFAGDVDNLSGYRVVAADYETAEGSLSAEKLKDILYQLLHELPKLVYAT